MHELYQPKKKSFSNCSFGNFRLRDQKKKRKYILYVTSIRTAEFYAYRKQKLIEEILTRRVQ